MYFMCVRLSNKKNIKDKNDKKKSHTLRVKMYFNQIIVILSKNKILKISVYLIK